MKRIRNAALLAAVLAFSGTSQAQTPATRARVHLEDAMTSPIQPNAYRISDPAERGSARGLDYKQESRLNDRQRYERRHKARVRKEQTRFVQ